MHEYAYGQLPLFHVRAFPYRASLTGRRGIGLGQRRVRPASPSSRGGLIPLNDADADSAAVAHIDRVGGATDPESDRLTRRSAVEILFEGAPLERLCRSREQEGSKQPAIKGDKELRPANATAGRAASSHVQPLAGLAWHAALVPGQASGLAVTPSRSNERRVLGRVSPRPRRFLPG